MALPEVSDHPTPEAEEEQNQQEQPPQQPQGDLQHPIGPSSDMALHVNGTGTGAGSSSSRSLSSATSQTAAATGAETVTSSASTKREGQRRKGNTWLDIFSFGRWRSSSNRPHGAIQLAQAFGAPNQPGRPGPVIGVFVCKGPRNELQGLVVASPLSLERFSFEGRLLQRAAPPQPLTCCRGGKIGGVGRVLLCGSQAGRVFIVNAETFDLMLELDTKKAPPSGEPLTPEPPLSSTSSSSSTTEGDPSKKGTPGCAARDDGASDVEIPICSLTINATFAEFAHFVLAGDALGRTFVWQVPSTKLLLVLPPPEISEQHKRRKEEVGCCGCCAKLHNSSEAFAAAASELMCRPERDQALQQPRQQSSGAIHAVGTVSEVSVPQQDTDDEGPGKRGPDSEGERDALAPACDIPPSYQNAQWLSAKPRGKKKKSPAPASEPPPLPQGDQQEQVQQEVGIESSLFSGDDSGEENERSNELMEKTEDSSALLQSEENVPYIQHAPQELLEQLRTEAQQRHKQQRQMEKTDQSFSSEDLPEAERTRAIVTSGTAQPDPVNASCSPTVGGSATPAGGVGENCCASEEAGALESVPLSPEACKPPVNSPCAPMAVQSEGPSEAVPPLALPDVATCDSSNCCVAQGRAPCGRKQRRSSVSSETLSRYVGAMLPLAALDQLWIGYGDGSLAVFSLSTYQLLYATQLTDPDISKIEYAKYRDLIVAISANRALSMWCPRTLQCIFDKGEGTGCSCFHHAQGCMDGSICVRRLERDLADGGISCKLVRNYIREVEPQVPISCILVDSWLNAAFVGDASGVVFTLPYVFQLLEAPALANTQEAEA